MIMVIEVTWGTNMRVIRLHLITSYNLAKVWSPIRATPHFPPAVTYYYLFSTILDLKVMRLGKEIKGFLNEAG